MAPIVKEITCKVHDANGRVTHVGVHGERWSVDQVWDMITSGTFEFFTKDSRGNKAKVYARTTPGGRKYITTHPDKTIENNLDELPDC